MILKRPLLSDRQFQELRRFIHDRCGINLGPAKKTMLEGRLQKRLAYLEMESFDQYSEYLFSSTGLVNELPEMLDVVTTNKTDFFRESVHFEYLEKEFLPHMVRTDRRNSVNVWSAACSTGQEPYTIAMVLENAAEKNHFDYRILATDISSRVLARAKSATYHATEADTIPHHLRKKYLLRSKDPATAAIRIVPALRGKVEFQRLNLIAPDLRADSNFDIVFCRNVLIYFDKPTQQRVVTSLVRHLNVGGILLIGHSESIFQMDHPLRQIRPTIYQKI